MLRLCTFLKRTPFEPTRCFVRAIFVTAQRKNESAPKTDDNQPKKEFQTIFKFPHMRILVLLNRLKVYQTIITGLTIPVSLTLSHFNVIQFNTALAACAVGFSACLPLYGLSFFFKDIVGFIYANEDATKIKIAYLDFWGKRVDIIVDTNDIIPFSEQPQSLLAAFYVNLCRYSTKDKLKVNLRFGRILDNDRFMQIFSKPAYY